MITIIIRSSRNKEIRGEPLRGERSFMERGNLWRDSSRRAELHGERLSVERCFEEREAPWRDASRREMKDLSQGRL